MLSTISTEFRLACRSLLRQPGFTAIAVLTLALGIGSVSAIYSVVNGVLLQPLPYPQAERIIRINRQQGAWGGPVSAPLLRDWREGSRDQFEVLAGFSGATANLGGAGDPERLAAYRVSPEFWDVMGIAPLRGRYFGSAEENARERVVVLGERLWQTRFAGDPDLIGSDIQLDGQAYRVTGIVPERFRYPGRSQIYLPTYLRADESTRGNNYLSVIGRLRPDASLEQAEAALEATNVQLRQQFPDNHEELRARLLPLDRQLTSWVREPLLILLAASALVLLIACANLANLMLARGSSRQRELAVRAALGAGRRQLLRIVLLEATIVAMSGAVAGVLLASAAVPALLALAPQLLPSHSEAGMRADVVGVSLLLGLSTVLLFGLWPALRSAATSPGSALKEEGRDGSGGRSKGRARSALVAIEVALSLTLLVGAGLLIESLRNLGNIETGVNTENVLTASLVLDGVPTIEGEDNDAGYRRLTQKQAPQMDALLARIATIPGVTAVGLSDALPLSGLDNASSDIGIVGRPNEAGKRPPGANWRFVSPGLFDALGMRMVSGRALQPSDQAVGEYPRQVLVNETFARRYLGGLEPIGTQLVFFGSEPKTIVGVVSDSRLMGVEYDTFAEVYMLAGHSFQRQFQLALKVEGEPMGYVEQLRQAVREVSPNSPLFDLRSMDELAASGTALRRFNMILMGVFSGVALLLAMIGLYGVIAYSVAERRQEFGIRMSLGANSSDVLRMVLGQGLRMTALGLLLGLLGAWLLGRGLASQLYGVGSTDLRVFSVVALLLLLTALFACLVPARRATRVDPMTALRSL